MNALQVLRQDHSTVKNLFGVFDRTSKTAHEKRGDIFIDIRRELQLHSKAEQEIFYPALKALNGDGRRLASEATKQHKEIDELLIQISRLSASDKNFVEKVETLMETVEHHMEEEEGEIFHFAEENCSEEQLEEIGQQIEERKRVLDQQRVA
jgi:hemerythrin superfamily protein